MTSKKRTNSLIASEILKICVNGANKTRIEKKGNKGLNSAVASRKKVTDEEIARIREIRHRFWKNPFGLEVKKYGNNH
jgi:predicted transcriptional regulator